MKKKMDLKRYPGGLELHEEHAIDRICRTFVQQAPNKSSVRQSGNSFSDAFKAAGFSEMYPWKGYAGFRFAGKTNQGRDYEGEYDLVIITHHNILVIELKQWRGKITSSDGHWYQNGNVRENAYITTERKKFFLENRLKKIPQNQLSYLKNKKNKLRFEFFIVFTIDTDFSLLPPEERKHCLTFAQFLDIATEEGFNNRFTHFHPKAVGLNKDIIVFDRLFGDNQTKPKELIKNGYIKQELIFPATQNLANTSVYSEYMAKDQRTQKQQALMRCWRFGNFQDYRVQPKEARLQLVAHEHDVLNDIQQKDPELFKSCMHPKTSPVIEDMGEEFYELFEMPADQERFNFFIERLNQDVFCVEAKLDLIEVVLSKFAALHEVDIAHRDIGSHSIWLNHGNKITISSFVTAFYRPIGTVGEVRTELSMSEISAPNSLAENSRLTAYQQDIYALAIVSHLIFTGQRITPKNTVAAHKQIETAEDWFHLLLRKGICEDWKERYRTARELLEAIQKNRPIKKAELRVSSEELNQYRGEFNPYLDFPPTEQLISSNPSVQAYFSSEFFLKLWSGVNPQDGDAASIIKVQQFCETASIVQAKAFNFFPVIKDFGISLTTTQLYLVQEKINGKIFKEFLKEKLELNAKIEFVHKLMQAVTKLHNSGLTHGDLHPGNILVVDNGGDKEPIIIDYPDFCFGRSRALNHDYSPANVESIPIQETDSWGTLCLVKDVLNTIPSDERNSLVTKLESAIAIELSEDNELINLERVLDQFDEPDELIENTITIGFKNLDTNEFILLPDNGKTHLTAEPAKQSKNEVLITLSGINGKLRAFFNPFTETVKNILGVYPQESASFQRTESSFCSESVRVEIQKNAFNQISELTHYLSGLDGFSSYCRALLFDEPELDVISNLEDLDLEGMTVSAVEQDTTKKIEETVAFDSSARFKALETYAEKPANARLLWPVIIDAEMRVRPRARVSSIDEWSVKGDQKRIGYSAHEEFMESWARNDKIEVFRKADGGEYFIGDVAIGETLKKKGHLKNALILNSVKRFRLSEGDEIIFDSAANRGSLKRRKNAVDHIIQGGSAIPELIDLFDSPESSSLVQYTEKPSSQGINAFADKLEIQLNESQVKAIQNTITYGPVSLVQGPPGTGKTHFIGIIVAYLFEQMGAKNVLLASQSHEAVNTAAEKVRKISSYLESDVSVVRFSNKTSNVSDALQDVLSPNIISGRVEAFKAQYLYRIRSMGRMLGISTHAVDEITRFFQLMYKHEKAIKSLNISSMDADTSKEDRKQIFISSIEDNFGFELGEDLLTSAKDHFCVQYGLVESEFLKLQDLMKIADDYIDRLESSRDSYETFLAKTRNLVCGTCVGLGKPNYEIQKTIFDWVIVDEAARSTASELAIAMQSGKRILLVGDHKQLPPLYDQELKKEIKSALGIQRNDVLNESIKSDFQRLFESDYGKKASSSLTDQYRMLPAIGNLVAEVFYEELRSKRTTELLPHAEFDLPLELVNTVTWLDTSKLGRIAHHDDKQQSPSNEAEAREIVRVLTALRDNNSYLKALSEKVPGVEPIGVICMYAGQRDLILRKVSEAGLKEDLEGFVKIDTVDSYQGKENPIVIVSLSLFSKELNPRFLREENRINVALSRAMERLIIVGAAKMWDGKNSQLPLGKVLSYVTKQDDQSGYKIVPAQGGKQ